MFYMLGGTLIAVGISSFAVPNNSASGGFSGIATLLNYLFSLPVGTVVLVMNVPVFIIGVQKFGLKFLYRTVIATVIMSVLIDAAAVVLPVYCGCSFGRWLCAGVHA